MDTAFFTTVNKILDSDIVDQGQLLATADRLLKHVLASQNLARAGFWLFDSFEHRQLIATLIIDTYHRKRDTTARLQVSEFPEFFLTLDQSKSTVLHQHQQHLIGQLTQKYLKPLNIHSMLCISIQVKGRCVGFLICESVGNEKQWHETEKQKAIYLTNIFARCVSAAENNKQQNLPKPIKPQETHVQAIHESINKFSLITATNPEGVITDINQNYLSLTGYDRSEVIGQSQRIFHSQVHTDEYYRLMWRLLKQGRTWRGRLCNKKKNGELFWIDATIKPIFKQSHHQLEGYIGYYHDITTQVETEQQLLQSEKLAKLGSFRQEQHSHHWHCSEQLHRLLQIPLSDLITPEHFENILAPDQRAIFHNQFNALKHDKSRINLTIKTNREVEQWIQFTAQRQGHWIIGNVQDITELHKKDAALQQTVLFQQAIFDSANFTVIATNTTGTITHFNKTAEHLLGYTAEELIGVETPMIFHDPNEIAEFARQMSIERATLVDTNMSLLIHDAKQGITTEREWHYISRNGQRIPIALSITAIKSTHDEITGYLGVGKDLRTLKHAQKETSRLDTILSTAGKLAHFGGFQYDVEEDQLHLTHHDLQQTLAPTKSAIHFHEAVDNIHPDYRSLFQRSFDQAISDGKAFDIQIKVKRSEDSYDWLRCAGTAHIVKQRVQTILGFVHTINEQKELEQKLSILALTDELTGLNNRRALMQVMESEWHRFHRYKSKTTLLLLDIDFFKQVNDQWGHDVGDHVLVHFAKRVKGLLRSSDTFGRIGGEEFLILTSNNTEQDACILAEKIRESIANKSFEYNVLDQAQPLSLIITISIGVTELTDDIKTLDQWLIEADKALYQAKTNGRNQVISTQSIKNTPVSPSIRA